MSDLCTLNTVECSAIVPRPGASAASVSTPRGMYCTKTTLLVFSVPSRFGLSRLARARSRVARAAWSHSHGAQWPFQTPVASGLRGAHTVHDTVTERRFPSARGCEPPKLLRTRSAPGPCRMAPGHVYAISYDLQWHRAVNEQSLRHGCYIHARLRRAFELFDYDNTTLHLPVRSHPVPRRSHRPHTAPPCICIRAEADPSIALRCTAEL